MSAQKNSKLSKFFNDIDEAIETFTNHDYGEDYKYYAKTNLKNGHYGLALLQFIDGCIEYTKDIFTAPAAKATAKIDNLCKENLGLDLSEIAMTLYSGGVTAPLGAYLENVSIWANSTAAATGSKVITTATAVTVEIANQAAGLVGVQPSDIVFSDKFLKGNYKDQVTKRGWTLEKIANTLNDPYKTTSQHINKYTGNTVTYYYIDEIHYVARDDITEKIIQISDLTKDSWK